MALGATADSEPTCDVLRKLYEGWDALDVELRRLIFRAWGLTAVIDRDSEAAIVAVITWRSCPEESVD